MGVADLNHRPFSREEEAESGKEIYMRYIMVLWLSYHCAHQSNIIQTTILTIGLMMLFIKTVSCDASHRRKEESWHNLNIPKSLLFLLTV
jgi:hypothetical protein